MKLVSRAEIEEHEWSLTPGRYVGVAPEEEDEDFDFGEALRSIHIDLEGLMKKRRSWRRGFPETSRSWGCERTLLTLDQLGTVSRGRSRHRPRDADFLYDGPYPLVQRAT